MKIWRNRATLDPDLSFSAYVFKIAYRDIALQLRRIMRRQAYCHETLESSIPLRKTWMSVRITIYLLSGLKG